MLFFALGQKNTPPKLRKGFFIVFKNNIRSFIKAFNGNLPKLSTQWWLIKNSHIYH
jgi:hypothetical protein